VASETSDWQLGAVSGVDSLVEPADDGGRGAAKRFGTCAVRKGEYLFVECLPALLSRHQLENPAEFDPSLWNIKMEELM